MLDQFSEIWMADFEFQCLPGERPKPLCLVAQEFRSGRRLRVWFDDPNNPPPCPIPNRPDILFIAYYASADLGCYLANRWSLPSRVIDPYCEFRNLTNGKSVPSGKGLLGALAWFGLGAIQASEKQEFRELAMRGGPYTEAEKVGLMTYCEEDVNALNLLLPRLVETMNVQHALSRGRYMKAVAHMEFNGIPIDTTKLAMFREHWCEIQERLIGAIDAKYHVYDGRTFKADRWAGYLAANNIPWPRLDSGRLSLDDETFREMAKRYPKEVGPIRELRYTLGQLRLNELAVGADGRNRCLLSPFQSSTGRNQPSNSKFIFGPSAWFRSLIKPEPGRAVAYVDWSQQEFGIAAALSGDAAMMEAYTSGDPYLTFAKQAGAVPSDATKQTHPIQRAQFKDCALGVQYGMGEQSLALSLGEPTIVGRELLRLHRQTYPTYWRWSQAAVDHAMLLGRLHTVFGWQLSVGKDANPRSLANFPCQANGAEVLRLACCLIVERGIKLLGPIHDAVFVEGPAERIEEDVAETQAAMCEAGRIILNGFELRTDVDIVTFPNRYFDERGVDMWNQVNRILADLVGQNLGSPPPPTTAAHRYPA